MEGDGVSDRIGGDPVREITAPGGFQAGAGAHDAGKVGAVVVGAYEERALDGASEIRGSHQRARRIADPLAKLERVSLATVGGGRQRGSEVGYEARAVAATDTPKGRQPVVCEHERLPRSVAGLVDRVERLLSNHDQRAAAMGAAGRADGDVNGVGCRGEALGFIPDLDGLDDPIPGRIDPGERASEFVADPNRRAGGGHAARSVSDRNDSRDAVGGRIDLGDRSVQAVGDPDRTAIGLN